MLRELLHRKHATIVYARNPSKIPEELVSNSLLEVSRIYTEIRGGTESGMAN